jgi:hypothetical protein
VRGAFALLWFFLVSLPHTRRAVDTQASVQQATDTTLSFERSALSFCAYRCHSHGLSCHGNNTTCCQIRSITSRLPCQ